MSGALTLDARLRGHDEKAGITYADFCNEVLVFRSNQMIHSPRLRSRQAAVPSESTVNHVFDPEH